jgi:hypothetical protein
VLHNKNFGIYNSLMDLYFGTNAYVAQVGIFCILYVAKIARRCVRGLQYTVLTSARMDSTPGTNEFAEFIVSLGAAADSADKVAFTFKPNDSKRARAHDSGRGRSRCVPTNSTHALCYGRWPPSVVSRWKQRGAALARLCRR